MTIKKELSIHIYKKILDYLIVGIIAALSFYFTVNANIKTMQNDIETIKNRLNHNTVSRDELIMYQDAKNKEAQLVLEGISNNSNHIEEHSKELDLVRTRIAYFEGKWNITRSNK